MVSTPETVTLHKSPLAGNGCFTSGQGNYVFSEAQLKQVGMAFPGASIKVCEEYRDNIGST